MQAFDAILKALGINEAAVVFGFFGALLHALRTKGKHWIERWVAFTVGFVLATIAPGFVIKWFSLQPDPTYFGGLGFVFGYFGMSLVDVVGEFINNLKTMDWKDIIASWVKRG